MIMKVWKVSFGDEFAPEFDELSELVQDELLALVRVLEEFGPMLGRPRADTLNDSKYANMKELRFEADDGIWRIAFAFDPTQKAVLLLSGNKSGVSEKMFYKRLIRKADKRYENHLTNLE
jgi:hypothetical protein